MSGIAKKNIQKEIRRIQDEISDLKDCEVALEMRRSKQQIQREQYYTEVKLLQQKEEQLLKEKEDILAEVIYSKYSYNCLV